MEQFKKNQSDIYQTVTRSLGLSDAQKESFQDVLGKAIGYFDELLGLEFTDSSAAVAKCTIS